MAKVKTAQTCGQRVYEWWYGGDTFRVGQRPIDALYRNGLPEEGGVNRTDIRLPGSTGYVGDAAIREYVFGLGHAMARAKRVRHRPKAEHPRIRAATAGGVFS